MISFVIIGIYIVTICYLLLQLVLDVKKGYFADDNLPY